MTDGTVTAIIGGIPATIAALAAALIGWRNSRKADVIHTLVNSNLTAVKSDLAMALQRVDALSALVAKLSGGATPAIVPADPYAAQRAEQAQKNEPLPDPKLPPLQKLTSTTPTPDYKPGL